MSVPPPVSAVATAVTAWLDEHEAEMFELLRRSVEINSHTADKSGVDKTGRVFQQAMKDAGLHVVVQPQLQAGDNLLGRNPAVDKHDRQVLLLGHLDTVFPPDMGFDEFTEDGEFVRGPGVYDMKGGLVAAIYAVKALDHAGLLADIPVTMLLNSDEETGSRLSRGLILAEAKKSLFSLVFEGRGLKGQLATGRKGKVTYELTVTGQAGHVGDAGAGKPSAILELARLVQDLEALNDPDQGLQVNVGLISGGSAPNAVPRTATASLDLRFPDADAGRELNARILDRCEAPATPGTSIEIEVVSGRPAMVPNTDIRRLLEEAKNAGQALGQEVGEETRGGVSDANYIAAAGVPVLDGLGPRGALDHSPEEYIVRTSLKEAAALAALTIWLSWERMRGA